MLFNNSCSQRSEPEPSESGSNESDQQSAKTELKNGPDDVSPVEETNEGWWHMSFDGTVSKKGVGEGISIRPPIGEPKLLS